ncbi:MAG: PQQ-dependent sugar dehydrogenase [Bacteroidota bacterium]
MKRLSPTFSYLAALVLLLALGACAETSKQSQSSSPYPSADADNGGIKLPEGFGAAVVADDLGRVRHIAVRDNGDIFVKLRKLTDEGTGILGLRDNDGDGRADEKVGFGDYTGTGIAIYQDQLYATSDTAVYRYSFAGDALMPNEQSEDIVTGFPRQGQHANKAIAFDEAGHLYVDIGGPSNACQEQARSKGSPGLDPCPQREWAASVWQFDANKTGQTLQEDGIKYATGIRNAVAIDWSSAWDALFLAQHGRDDIYQLWPDFYKESDNAELPAEEFLKVNEGDDFGWPYCYYDHFQNQKMLAPEYGGDGKKQGRCEGIKAPAMAFPAHWAPNDLLFYTGDLFPERYKNGAFIAFHGSWNRAPQEQQGYKVVFIPFANGMPSGDFEEFALGFPGIEEVKSPGDALHRPMGLAQGPDGSLYITDSVSGRIWRIIYYGDA